MLSVHVLCWRAQFNHVPGSFQIGRKDRLWRNLHRATNTLANTAAARACTAGVAAEQAFDYVPLTFVLPDDLELFRRAYDDNDHQGKRNIWIVKPVRRLSSLPFS